MSNYPSMSVTTKLVQSVLYTEMIIFASLILPLPKTLKKSFIKFIYTSRALYPIIHILYVIYAMIFLMFLDSIFKPFTYDYLPYHLERNYYLSGFTLYLTLVFKIYISMLNSLYIEEERVYILKKQIDNSQVFIKETIEKSEIKIKTLEKEVSELNKKILSDEILIKQYENNKNEYFKLMDKYNELNEKMNRENKKSK